MRETVHFKIPTVIPINVGEIYASKTNPKLKREVVAIEILTEKSNQFLPVDLVQISYKPINKDVIKTCGLVHFLYWAGMK